VRVLNKCFKLFDLLGGNPKSDLGCK